MPNLNDGLGAAAATCERGYYLKDGTCSACTTGTYCPGDDTAHACPADTTNWPEILAQMGYDVVSIGGAAIMSWNNENYDEPIYKVTYCYTGRHVTTTGGRFYMEHAFNGTDYNSNTKYLWTDANNGYYLSPYSGTTYRDWYRGVKPCTNAPAHAHYTGPGTPDEPQAGGATDFNDCPWACDAGYGRVGDECRPLCGAGVTQLRAGDMTVPLWAARQTTPALVVGINGSVCYGNLTSGRGDGINIQYSGQNYHTVQ